VNEGKEDEMRDGEGRTGRGEVLVGVRERRKASKG